MNLTDLPLELKKFEIQTYQPPRDARKLCDTHVPFTGSPRKHPADPERVILVSDPYGDASSCYEFLARDIAYAEELPNIVDVDGNTVPMARIWVRKGCIGKRCSLFVVADVKHPKAP